MATERIKMGIEIVGIKETMKLLKGMDKELSKQARQISFDITDQEANAIRDRAGRSGNRQSIMAARSVKAKRDRVPTIQGGGSMRLSPSKGKKVPAEKVFFGAEFGGQGRKTTMQFRPHLGRTGYFFWPQLRDDTDQMFEDWSKALQKLRWDDNET